MATVKFFLGIVCLALAGSDSLPGGNSINLRQDPALADRKRLLQVAEKELGVRERSGKNDGPRVAEYLSYVNVPEGSAWCAAFVSWVFGQAGYPVPRTAWSPALFPLSKRTKEIMPAVVFGIYFSHLKRIAHCGLVERQDGDWIVTIEGNTNPAGNREGDGVYRKRRHLKAVKYFADWAKRKGADNEN